MIQILSADKPAATLAKLAFANWVPDHTDSVPVHKGGLCKCCHELIRQAQATDKQVN